MEETLLDMSRPRSLPPLDREILFAARDDDPERRVLAAGHLVVGDDEVADVAVFVVGIAVVFGDIDGVVIVRKPYLICAMHGASFRIRDGVCAGGPALGTALKREAISVENGIVLLGAWRGTAA